MYNTKSEPLGKLWTLSDYQLSMQVYSWEKQQQQKGTILVSDFDNRGDFECTESGWELSLNFTVNLKML